MVFPSQELALEQFPKADKYYAEIRSFAQVSLARDNGNFQRSGPQPDDSCLVGFIFPDRVSLCSLAVQNSTDQAGTPRDPSACLCLPGVER